MSSNQNLLAGLRILDLSRVLAGPLCTRLFAEFGAEVIKIESAPPAPTLGEHNETVLTELLGRSADEVAALVAAGTLVKKNL